MTLEVKNITSGYVKEVPVLTDVSIVAREGALTGIIGPNGAGKSTLLKTIYGYLYPSKGDVFHHGKSIKGLKPDQMLGQGIAHLIQGHSVFPTMTVEENLELGGWIMRNDRKALDRALAEVYEYYPVLKKKRRMPAGALSGGEQRMLEIARLTMTRPRTILIDEPSVGLMPKLVDTVYEEIVRLKEQGFTILIVDQKVHKCVEVADYIYVLRLGRNSHHGPKERFVDTIEDIIREWI
ncbi:MAG: ABC transporter ATP-binding protein [Deltaproteobacteria bacterium]|nr:ABC transporter ATP-binding protein [Deltaproteobacteria bacterium]MBW2122629.1 ABC transporter ATP-binding protein [Deltaproteobacteria bacterium]